MIMKRRREGKEREAPTRKIKISKFSHGSRVTKFRTMAHAQGANRPARPSQHIFFFCDGCDRRRSWLLLARLGWISIDF